ncbi:MAG: polyprenyl synthetase family protein [Deinococcales bacterium]
MRGNVHLERHTSVTQLEGFILQCRVTSLPDAILGFLDGVLPQAHATPEIALLYKMMRDYPWRGGKMIRSKLLMASTLAHGGQFEVGLPLAAALELFQNWVLVHDDIEDDSDERRGKPALHRIYGVPLALNAGDALHVYMWQVVFGSGVKGAIETFLEMIHRTAEGQHMDLSFVQNKRWDVSTEDYLQLVRLKTAYYTVVAPLVLGALAAGATPSPDLGAAGLDLGVAFQIRDDVLNLTANFAEYGKEIGGDLFEGKRTLMLLRLLEQASQERQEIIALLEQPRDQKTPAQMEKILGAMRRYGCIEYAQTIAQEHAERGLKRLEQGLANAVNSTAVAEILGTARNLTTRNA